MEHYYTAQVRPKITDDAWGNTPEVVKQNLVSGWVEQVGAHVAAGAAEGGFDREDAHMTRSALMLDEKGWKAISRELTRTLERIEKLGAEAAARVKKDPESGFRATTVLMHFEGPSTAAGLPADAGIRRHRKRRAKTAT